MSSENITLMLNKTIQILNLNIGKKTFLEIEEILQNKKQVYHDLQKEFNDVTLEIVNEIFNRLFNQKFVYNSQISFESGTNSFRELENKYPDIKIPSKYKKIDAQFNKLKKLPQPIQRSKEWYEYRYNRITASDMAAAIELNPYESVESFILKKCDPNFPFRDNATVFHGKKYESTATLIYEHIYNIQVYEFGALPSEQYEFLGASPDGICSKYTLDNQFSERIGIMLEIKCPVIRDIITKGKIVGDICPFYYYCQVQQQLVCCELEKCDFWQCKISEYPNKEAYLADNCQSCINTFGVSDTKMSIDNKLKKGIILEFYPKKFIPEFDGDKDEWKSKYIIPKRLDMDELQYESWVFNMLDNYKELYPEIEKDYYFYRIIYWKLESSHNVEIVRDDKFFNSILPILKETWSKILYYRKNQNKLDELKEIADKRKKYIKIQTSYSIHNDDIILNKFKILNENFDTKLLIKSKTQTKYSSYSKNYIKSNINQNSSEKKIDYESDVCDFIDENPVINKKNTKSKSITKTLQQNKNSIEKKIDYESDACDFIDENPVINKKNTKSKSITLQQNKNSIEKKIDYESDACDFIDENPVINKKNTKSKSITKTLQQNKNSSDNKTIKYTEFITPFHN